MFAHFEGDCEGITMQFQVFEINSGELVFQRDYVSPYSYGTLKTNFQITNKGCASNPTSVVSCKYEGIAKIFDADGNLQADDDTDEIKFKLTPGEVISTADWNVVGGQIWEKNEDFVVCRTKNLQLFNVNKETGAETPLTPGMQSSGFYSDDDQPVVKVRAIFKDCDKSVGQIGYGWYQNTYEPLFGTAPLPYRFRLKIIPGRSEFVRNSSNVFVYESAYTLGDEGCGPAVGNGIRQCRINFLSNDQADANWFSQNRPVTDPEKFGLTLGSPLFTATQETGGHIVYFCDDECDTEWGEQGKPQGFECLDEECTKVSPIQIADNPFLSGYITSIKNSPCYIPPVNQNDPTDYGRLKPDCYELLAPLPGLEAIGVPDSQAGENRITGQFSIGFWVNRMVTFLIGLVGLLAVIMIIIAGVQYMTTDVIGQKSNAKERIIQSLLGLVIALGVFVILNTINPDLLRINPNIEQVSLEYELRDEGIVLNGISPEDIPNDGNSCTDPAFIRWAQQNVPDIQLTDKNTGQSYSVPACDPSAVDIVTIGNGGATKVHKSLTPSINRINAALRAAGQSYDITQVGGYCCRMIKKPDGTQHTPPKISKHAFGVAIDINWSTNPFEETTLKTDMPAWFVNIWKAEGWGWGGEWNSSKDAMHFSKYQNEGGDGKGEL